MMLSSFSRLGNPFGTSVRGSQQQGNRKDRHEAAWRIPLRLGVEDRSHSRRDRHDAGVVEVQQDKDDSAAFVGGVAMLEANSEQLRSHATVCLVVTVYL